MLCDVLEALRVVAVLLSPVTPNLSYNILLQLGMSEAAVEQLHIGNAAWGGGGVHQFIAQDIPWFSQKVHGRDSEPGYNSALCSHLTSPRQYSNPFCSKQRNQNRKLRIGWWKMVETCAGLRAGQQTQKPTPVMQRLDREFVTEPATKKTAVAAA